MATAAIRKRGVTGWRLIASLVVLAFSFQSYVAQTHIHDAAPISGGIAKDAPSKNVSHNKSPLGNTPVECPFCQAVAHAGTFFIPVAPLLFLSAQWIETAIPHLAVGARADASAHSWQSRAPPRS